ncbi:MAG: TetR family transcriptional regulator [Acidobacteria bacterium]|nr:TetR family transcriptional regulator [Acidobacteriota bacterium]
MRGAKTKPVRYALRHARAAETRAAILRVAADNFATAGLAGGRMEAIARAAGVNKALLHYYFESKAGLYSAVLEEHMKEFSRRAQEVLSAPGPARSTVLRFVSLHFDFISARPYYPFLFQHVMMAGGRPLRRLMRKYLLPVGAALIRIVAEGIRRGEFRRVDPGQMAASLVGVTVFYFSSAPITRVLRGINPFDATHLRQRKEHVLEFVRFGLFRNPQETI